MAEGKARRHYAVEEAFEQRRKGAPPGRVDENQVLGPSDVALGPDQVRLKRLLLGRVRVDIRIETRLAQNQHPALHAGLQRTRAVSVKECAAKVGETKAGNAFEPVPARVWMQNASAAFSMMFSPRGSPRKERLLCFLSRLAHN